MKDFYMEDVHSVGLAGIDAIEKELKTKNISLTEEQIDKIYLAIEAELEKLSNGDYRSHL